MSEHPQRSGSGSERELSGGPTRVGQRFLSKSNREWEVIRVYRSKAEHNSFATVAPLGADTYGGGGGVKCRRVDLVRLDQQTHGWRWKIGSR